MDAPMSPVHPIALTVVLTLAGEPDAGVRMTKTLELACGTGLPKNIEKITLVPNSNPEQGIVFDVKPAGWLVQGGVCVREYVAEISHATSRSFDHTVAVLKKLAFSSIYQVSILDYLNGTMPQP